MKKLLFIPLLLLNSLGFAMQPDDRPQGSKPAPRSSTRTTPQPHVAANPLTGSPEEAQASRFANLSLDERVRLLEADNERLRKERNFFKTIAGTQQQIAFQNQSLFQQAQMQIGNAKHAAKYRERAQFKNFIAQLHQDIAQLKQQVLELQAKLVVAVNDNRALAQHIYKLEETIQQQNTLIAFYEAREVGAVDEYDSGSDTASDSSDYSRQEQ